MTQKRQKPGDIHYVNNREFTLALDDYSRACKQAEINNEPRPRMNNYLGEAIMKMSNRLAGSPRFRGYSYRDEMVSNGILAAVKYAHKFDGDRFDNGFAYITQILFSHFIITIKNEKKKYETNLKLIQEAQLGTFGDDEYTDVQDDHARSIADMKLHDLEQNKLEKDESGKTGRKGFHLRSGYTKEEREAYMGTPLVREDEDESEDD